MAAIVVGLGLGEVQCAVNGRPDLLKVWKGRFTSGARSFKAPRQALLLRTACMDDLLVVEAGD